jgi:N6-adenosine-specific RNA methylase IME4
VDAGFVARNRKCVGQMTPINGSGVFRAIVADPPWTPGLGGSWAARVDKARPQSHYPLMSLTEIEDLPVQSLAASQCHLYLWALASHADWGFRVARAWGFDPVTMLTWAKPGLGAGRFRCNTEHIVLARKGSRHGNPFGSGGRHAQATNGTLMEWPRHGHSVKPDEFYGLVERLSPGPRVDLFARRTRPGWECWGNEIDSTVVLAAP